MKLTLAHKGYETYIELWNGGENLGGKKYMQEFVTS